MIWWSTDSWSIVAWKALGDWLTVGQYISVESYSISQLKNVYTSLMCHWHFTNTSLNTSQLSIKSLSIVSLRSVNIDACWYILHWWSSHFATNEIRITGKVNESWKNVSKSCNCFFFSTVSNCAYDLLYYYHTQICMDLFGFVRSILWQIELMLCCICSFTDHGWCWFYYGRGNFPD